jgi:aminopeptidase N
MKDAAPQTVYLKDYKATAFVIESTNLTFDLYDDKAVVTANLTVARNSLSEDKTKTLTLNGSAGLDLQDLSLNGQSVDSSNFFVGPDSLEVFNVPDEFQLKTIVHILPHLNSTMMGLYRSRTMFCTQCEAEGFRDITYYIDRPDMMSEFTTTVIASKTTYPILLSNGNPIERGELDNGRHFVTWHDPFKKPAYLFALVAGTLSVVEDNFITQSGRNVVLQIFVEDKDIDKCGHAMLSLKKSMRWDETKYGREYDLDIFMIVAVDDFNMGAMENKGLNIFNTSAVLVSSEISTDAAFQRVESIVAHEYFHNWSGNRVTCRDWFQLSLKEGFTVYRDSQFSSDMNSPTVKRVEDVSFLRTHQFAEDGGPMSHSVQPESYMEINNFYTMTIYEKGSELVGMYHTLLGEETFRKASDLYFERHDGQAATVENFVCAMEDASGRDLSQFRLWYKQSGTPVLSVKTHYDEFRQSYEITFKQSCPDTPGQTNKKPFIIPIRLGIFDHDGKSIGLNEAGDSEILLEMTDETLTYNLENVKSKPIPSILRGFSAPVKLKYEPSHEELAVLMANDNDGFNRWDSGQRLILDALGSVVRDISNNIEPSLPQSLVEVLAKLLSDASLDQAMVSLMLSIPSEALLYELVDEINPKTIHHARNFVRSEIAMALVDEFEATYHELNSNQAYKPSAEQIGRRSLKNTALDYLMLLDEPRVDLAWSQYQLSDNMTDRSSALVAIVNCPSALDFSTKALASFENQYRDETLAMNLWLQIQATNNQPGALNRIKELMGHPAFSMTNPNKVRSLIGSFCSANLVSFHDETGLCYSFLREQILQLNKVNPQVAARLVTPLTQWKKLAQPYSQLMCDELLIIANAPDLVKDIYEIATKSL